MGGVVKFNNTLTMLCSKIVNKLQHWDNKIVICKFCTLKYW